MIHKILLFIKIYIKKILMKKINLNYPFEMNIPKRLSKLDKRISLVLPAVYFMGDPAAFHAFKPPSIS